MTKETQVAVNAEKIKNNVERMDRRDDILNGNIKRLWKSNGDLKQEIKDSGEKNEKSHEKIMDKFDDVTKKSTSLVNAAFITILSSTVVGLVVAYFTS